MRSPEALLRVADLSVSFPDAADAPVGVRQADFALRAGETLVLLGESGSGKSLLGAAIAGLLPPHARVAGRVTLDGQSLLDLDERSRERLHGRVIGFVPQSAGLSLNPVRTALSQVEEVFRRVNGLSRAGARAAALQGLADLGLPPHVAGLHPHRLSGGMRQRVLVAIGLAVQPRLLIADEPTKGLDERLRNETIRLFRQVRATRPDLAMLLITHDLAVAEALADRVGVLYAGVLVEDRDAAAFFRAPSHPYARRLLEASPRRSLTPIPGAPPEPGAVLAGCPFEPRCCRRTPVCQTGLPPDRGGPAARVLCHHPELAA